MLLNEIPARFKSVRVQFVQHLLRFQIRSAEDTEQHACRNRRTDYAGNVRRAPEQWQKLGLEWAYRLVREPQRAGRMAKLPLVLVYALGERLGGKRHEKG